MRKIFALLAAVVLLCALRVSVSAQTGASTVSVYATVSGDGSCQVTLTAMLHLEQPVEQLRFPLPRDAKSITLNGSRARTTKTDTAKLVDISRITGSVAGDFSVTLSYRLEDIVLVDENGLTQLELPLLSGFSYPVEQLEFSVTLPGQVPGKPAFSSGYHQANIEKDIDSSVSGAVITGTSTKELKDHETLVMTLTDTEGMFQRSKIELPDFELTNTLMIVSAVLALLYWLLLLRCGRLRRGAVHTPPEGYSAGQLRSVLHMQGADLTMMVFTWAQLGYLRIRIDRRGHVMLHKRMDMGNERSSFEQQCFRGLFSKRSEMVDTSGYHYAAQWQKVSKLPPNIRSLVHAKSGSTQVFRALAALIGLFGGAGLGIALGTGAAAQWLLVGLLAVFGAVSSWYITRWAYSLLAQDRRSGIVALVLAGVWLLLGLLGGVVNMAVYPVLAQVLAGLMAAFGGRRTDAGKQAAAQVLGLNRYLHSVSRQDLQRILQGNPDYFHDMAPYALALGADKAFAKRFGKVRLQSCPYLTADTQEAMTAMQWSKLLRRTANAMDARRRQLPREKLLGFLQSFIR